MSRPDFPSRATSDAPLPDAEKLAFFFECAETKWVPYCDVVNVTISPSERDMIVKALRASVASERADTSAQVIDLLYAAERVCRKYGRDEAGTDLDRSEWQDVRDAIAALKNAEPQAPSAGSHSGEDLPAAAAPSALSAAGRSETSAPEPWAYAVFQPAGSEFDYIVYPTYGDAESANADADEEREIIPLYPKNASQAGGTYQPGSKSASEGSPATAPSALSAEQATDVLKATAYLREAADAIEEDRRGGRGSNVPRDYAPDPTGLRGVADLIERLTKAVPSSAAVAVPEAVSAALMSADLYQVLMDVQCGIDSPGLKSMANGAIRKVDKARAALSAAPAARLGEPVAWAVVHSDDDPREANSIHWAATCRHTHEGNPEAAAKAWAKQCGYQAVPLYVAPVSAIGTPWNECQFEIVAWEIDQGQIGISVKHGKGGSAWLVKPHEHVQKLLLDGLRYRWFKSQAVVYEQLGSAPFWTTRFILNGKVDFDTAIDQQMRRTDRGAEGS